MNTQIAEKLKKKIKAGEYDFTIHAIERCIERDIELSEVAEAILSGDIIEHYPEEKYGESCLVCGCTQSKRLLHVNCSVDPIWIITAYDPALSPDKWEDQYRKRRTR